LVTSVDCDEIPIDPFSGEEIKKFLQVEFKINNIFDMRLLLVLSTLLKNATIPATFKIPSSSSIQYSTPLILMKLK
jgi:hypothetical protein